MSSDTETEACPGNHAVQHDDRLPREKREKFTSPFSQHWLVWTRLGVAIHQAENGCQAMADNLLVLVSHKTLHGAVSISKQ